MKVKKRKSASHHMGSEAFDVLGCGTDQRHVHHKILEFIIRLGLHLKKQEVLPYYKEPSLYTDYYSKFNDTSDTDNENNYYSDSAFHYLNTEIPKIKTLTEITTLNPKEFNKKYNKLMNERNY